MAMPAHAQPSPSAEQPHVLPRVPRSGRRAGTREKLKKWSLGDWLALARSQ